MENWRVQPPAPGGRWRQPPSRWEGWGPQNGPECLVEPAWATVAGRGALPPDLLPLSPCRRCPLGPGEPSRVPNGGARAHPHPAEPGGRCVGQLRAPCHGLGCHQLADSGTGLSLWLMAPGSGAHRLGTPWLTLLTVSTWHCSPPLSVSQGSVRVCQEAEGTHDPWRPIPRAAVRGRVPTAGGCALHPDLCLWLPVVAELGSLSSRWHPGLRCAEEMATVNTAIPESGLFKQCGGGGRWACLTPGPALPTPGPQDEGQLPGACSWLSPDSHLSPTASIAPAASLPL